MRHTLEMDIGQRLEGRHGLNTKRLESIALLAGRLFIRHRAVATLCHLNPPIQRDQTGEGIERQEEIDHRQRDGYMRSAFHE